MTTFLSKNSWYQKVRLAGPPALTASRSGYTDVVTRRGVPGMVAQRPELPGVSVPYGRKDKRKDALGIEQDGRLHHLSFVRSPTTLGRSRSWTRW